MKGIGAAEPYLAEQIRLEDESHVLRGYWASALLACGRLEDAGREAQASLRLDPKSPPGRAALVGVHVGRGEIEEALVIARELLAEYPNTSAALRVAYSLSVLGPDCFDEEEMLARLAPFGDSDPEVYQILVHAKINAHDLEGARQALDEAPACYRETYLLPHARAKLATLTYDLASAEAFGREAVALASEADGPWASLASALAGLGQYEEAIRCADFALEINCRNPVAFSAKARVAEKKGDPVEAERLRRESREAAPALTFLSIVQRANAEQRNGNFDAAQKILRELEQAESAFARRTGIRHRLIYLIVSERADLIEECLGKVPPEMEGMAVVMAARGKLALLRDRPAEAIALAEEGLHFHEEDHSLIIVWLEAKTKLNDRDAVREKARQWIEQLPGSPVLCAQHIIQLERNGYRSESDQLMEKAQRRFPYDQTLEMTHIRKLLRRGKFQEAQQRADNLSGANKEKAQKVIRESLRKTIWKLILSPKFWKRRFTRKKKD